MTYAPYNTCMVFTKKKKGSKTNNTEKPITVFPSIPRAPSSPFPLSGREDDGFGQERKW